MKNIKLFFKTILLLITINFINCTDIDDNLVNQIQNVNTEQLLNKDSELIKLIDRVVTNNNNSMEDIVCIDFVYPFKLLIYDTSFNIIGEKTVVGDTDFSVFLGSLSPIQNISISYPIQTTLADGTIFSVNNNTELKIAIDSCSKEDIVSYYSGLFCGNTTTKCVWYVPYKENFNNKYASGVFESKNDGTIKFTFENLVYTGTWTILFVNNELQININLEGTSAIAQDWNFSRKISNNVNGTGLTMTIEGLPKNIILQQSCEQSTIFQVEDIGPAGGIVFYDKGFYSLGWRYIEVASNNLDYFEWGCLSSLIANSNSSEIGMGFYNTAKIANFHDDLNNYYGNPSVCNFLNNGTVVSKKALLLESNNYKDWFLPSKDELNLIYQNLHLQSIGVFASSVYWTSTQVDASNVHTIDFSSGATIIKSKIPLPNNIKARAVRYF